MNSKVGEKNVDNSWLDDTKRLVESGLLAWLSGWESWQKDSLKTECWAPAAEWFFMIAKVGAKNQRRIVGFS